MVVAVLAVAGCPLVGGRPVVVAERRLLVVAGCPPVAAAAGLPLAGRPA